MIILPSANMVLDFTADISSGGVNEFCSCCSYNFNIILVEDASAIIVGQLINHMNIKGKKNRKNASIN